MVKISVVVASYKQHELLGLALNSLGDQMFQDFEVIVVTVKDDVDTNEGFKNYPVVMVKSEKADYIYQRNLGIQKASGDYITMFDSDDFCLPTKLAQEIALAEAEKAVLVYSTYIRCDANLVPLVVGQGPGIYILDVPAMSPPSYEALLQSCYIYDYSLVHKSMYEEFGLFNEELKQAAMYDKWLHIMEKYAYRVAYNPHPTFLYRTYPEQMHLTEQQRPEHSKLMSQVRLDSLKRFQSSRKAKWKTL